VCDVKELYGQSYSRVIVCFASFAAVHDCDMRHRRHGLRLLRDIIAGFDEVRHHASCLLCGGDWKLTTETEVTPQTAEH